MTPARRNLTAYKGDTYTHRIDFEDTAGDPVNVTGSTFTAQVRRYPAADAPLATFTVDTSQAATGRVVLTLPHATTSALPVGRHRWDVQQVTGGVFLTVMAGEFEVFGEVTR
jgi:hypothetical protein